MLSGGLVLSLVAGVVIASSAAASDGTIRPKHKFRPKVVGTPRVGAELRATRGTWTSSRQTVYTYRWLRCPVGAKCVRIPRASRPRFRPTSFDVGTRLRVIVTATTAAGSARVTSRPTPPVAASGKGGRVVALWHMDETSGSVMSDSAGTNDGTVSRVALGTPGVSGGAYSFDGQNSFVSVPSANDLNPGTANITLTLRLKTTSLPPPPPADFDLVRKGTYAVSEYKVELQHSGQASCGFQGSAGYGELIAGPPLDDGRWHEVQCVKAPTAIQLVIDGKTYTQAANVGSISNSAELVIGSHPGGDWYAGALDEISIAIG